MLGTDNKYNKKDCGPRHYRMRDKVSKHMHCWTQPRNEGHPSYGAGRVGIAEIKLIDEKAKEKQYMNVVTRVFAPFQYDNDTRCDLHPRWNKKGDKICFDSVFEGHRGVYIIEI